MEIGLQIAKYRKQKHLTQEQFGEAVGVSNRTVSKWESGASLPGIDLVPSITAALGITPDQLFGAEEPEEPATDGEWLEQIKTAIAAVVRDTVEDCVPDAVESAIEDLLPDAVSNALESADVGEGSAGKKHFMVFVDKQVVDCTGEVRIVEGNNSNGVGVGRYALRAMTPRLGWQDLKQYASEEEAAADLQKVYDAVSWASQNPVSHIPVKL